MTLATRIALWRYDHSRDKLAERLTTKVAWLLPRRIAYWAAIRVMAHATQGKWSSQNVPALYAMDALKRWDPK